MLGPFIDTFIDFKIGHVQLIGNGFPVVPGISHFRDGMFQQIGRAVQRISNIHLRFFFEHRKIIRIIFQRIGSIALHRNALYILIIADDFLDSIIVGTQNDAVCPVLILVDVKNTHVFDIEFSDFIQCGPQVVRNIRIFG